jgi:hypothetical protein
MRGLLEVMIVALILSVACTKDTPRHEIAFLHQATLTISKADLTEVTFDVELARDHQKRVQGLMHRYKMEPHQGMLFVFDYEDHQSFWMKDTYLSLDMLFIDEQFQIVEIYENAFPLCEIPILSERPAMYVLEILGGLSKKHGVAVGDMVSYKYIVREL